MVAVLVLADQGLGRHPRERGTPAAQDQRGW
ncbi:hypothetical protein BKA15_005380 [Microlunatus parietis]|uniref:Uncharacterized protein n=1 Tax=Microlunatus parietis TaxID=682979 RepID=A0A7Y9IBV1_9ACTN|nr:hypothetical protein [Microlunatus parietis]